jgi:hypothetical protein
LRTAPAPALPDRRPPAPGRTKDRRHAGLRAVAAFLLAALLVIFGSGGASVAARADAPVALLDAAKAMLAAPDRALKRPSAPAEATGDDLAAPPPAAAVEAQARGTARVMERREAAAPARTLSAEARAPPAPAG